MTAIVNGPVKEPAFTSISLRRRATDRVASVLVTVSVLVAVVPLLWVLYSVISKGVRVVSDANW